MAHEGVYIYKPSFISVPFNITTESLNCEGECLSAEVRKSRGVDAWLVASAVSILVPHPSAPWHQVN